MLRSKSRVMPAVAPRPQVLASHEVTARLAKLEEIEILVQVGEYREGSDALADAALASRAAIEAFLRQDVGDHSPLSETQARLAALGVAP